MAIYSKLGVVSDDWKELFTETQCLSYLTSQRVPERRKLKY